MALEVGRQVAERYQTTRMLGRGGFGETWEALDLQTQDRVAIKALDLSRVGDWKAVELFEREAHVLESLKHSRIPDYLDFIPVESDRTGFLIQELAPGADLERIVAAGRVSTEQEACELALKMLEILEYLYSRKPPVVHRDIKPSNILMDEEGEVHLVDFGSVQDIRRRTAGGGSTVAGTFGYMAPEQLQGIATPASDLYGLGMTLLYVLWGKDPAEMPQKRLKADFRKVLKVSDHFADFLERMIEPVAEDRFSSPIEARKSLQGAMTPSKVPETDFATIMGTRSKDVEKADRRAKSILERTKPRVLVEEDQEGWLVRLEPVPFGARFFAHLVFGIPLFLVSGFFVAGSNFLGPYWPVFSDWWPGRWMIWFFFVIHAAALVAKMTGRAHILRLTRDGHYGLQVSGKKKPLEFGRLSELSVDAEVKDGFGKIALPKNVKLTLLNPLDVKTMNRTLLAAERASKKR